MGILYNLGISIYFSALGERPGTQGGSPIKLDLNPGASPWVNVPGSISPPKAENCNPGPGLYHQSVYLLAGQSKSVDASPIRSTRSRSPLGRQTPQAGVASAPPPHRQTIKGIDSCILKAFSSSSNPPPANFGRPGRKLTY
ncbi:hypothetical protein TNIN_178831 [Trichonephila inaurata madagascariensis]|uniref:Uncharacterized protein n=1 Tax=Trichonephila inaurata madagascariensis TaxID=2747483 RepID=A0A8X6XN83_9ARAC|nr:hypothetical protein TNIN_178831 [Trichonephila inaurata madagascariensis]